MLTSYNILHYPQSDDGYPWAPPPVNNPWTRSTSPRRAPIQTNCQVCPLQPVTDAIQLPTFAEAYAKTLPLEEFNECVLQAIRTLTKRYTRHGLILSTSLEHLLRVHFLSSHGKETEIPKETRIEHVKELVSAHPNLFRILYREDPLCVIGLKEPLVSNYIPRELMILNHRMF